jgi:ATPase subunit of ABC transporter with duplicated ATPase domains
LRQFHGTILMVTHDAYFASAVGYTRHWQVHDGFVRLDDGSATVS